MNFDGKDLVTLVHALLDATLLEEEILNENKKQRYIELRNKILEQTVCRSD